MNMPMLLMCIKAFKRQINRENKPLITRPSLCIYFKIQRNKLGNKILDSGFLELAFLDLPLD